MRTPLTPGRLREAFPREGLFEGKEWLFSPEPFFLEPRICEELRSLGALLERFLLQANRFYFESREGVREPWVARLLDRGKPPEVLDLGLLEHFRHDIPRVIRPDLLLTAGGLFLTEIDSLPGGIGVLGWLNQLYAGSGWDVIGGARGMIDGFSRVLGEGIVVFSRESEGYRPEMEWMLNQIDPASGSGKRVWAEADFDAAPGVCDTIYRFFELWDLPNVRNRSVFERMAVEGSSRFTPPMKAFLEEKLWLALLWAPGLRGHWEELLGRGDFETLQRVVPRGWVLDPEPLPYFAEYHGLGIQSWVELRDFTQKERRLVLKISGFSESAWGSRGVHIGHDLSAGQWGAVLEEALGCAGKNPYILQRFHQAKAVDHPFWDPQTGKQRVMRGRVRLCPYYFCKGGSVQLEGVLATICPEDKKIIHGMRDSILVPCVPG